MKFAQEIYTQSEFNSYTSTIDSGVVDCPHVLSVLYSEFDHWIYVDKTLSHENLMRALDASDAWESEYTLEEDTLEDDVIIITKSVALIITLLSSLQSRMDYVNSNTLQLSYVQQVFIPLLETYTSVRSFLYYILFLIIIYNY